MSKKWFEWLWDAWCVASLVGVWPRHIEPKLLSVTQLVLPIPSLLPSIEGFKILHFSDLHWKAGFSKKLQKKLLKKAQIFQPDLIVFTGDFLCRSQLENKEDLRQFLLQFSAPCGCFAVLGNHDYEKYVTVNSKGDYAIDETLSSPVLGKGFKRLFSRVHLTGHLDPELKKVKPHAELMDVLSQTSFQLLTNQTKQITFKGATLNITGLEEYSLGKSNLDQAFHNYDIQQIGIVLLHNPDLLKTLKDYPGELLLAGHTHGGQINLPFIWKKFTKIENPEFKRGLKKIGEKWGYINRGISSVMTFRWFSKPELTFLTLQRMPEG